MAAEELLKEASPPYTNTEQESIPFSIEFKKKKNFKH